MDSEKKITNGIYLIGDELSFSTQLFFTETTGYAACTYAPFVKLYNEEKIINDQLQSLGVTLVHRISSIFSQSNYHKEIDKHAENVRYMLDDKILICCKTFPSPHIKKRMMMEIINIIYEKESYNRVLEIEAEFRKITRGKRNKIEKTNNRCFFVKKSVVGYQLSTIDFKDKIKTNIKLHYNDDLNFDKIHTAIKSNQNGLILMGGNPGTGKSTLIRYLMKKNPKKVFCFLPSYMISSLESPEFISFTLDNLRNSVLVIEDAENILITRDQQKGAAISSVLNLSSGTLGMISNITIIATYNTDQKLDNALFRKGRLIYKYIFGPLSVEKANNLSRELNSNVVYSQPTTIAEITNPEENGGEVVKRTSVGFGLNKVAI